MKLGEAKFVNLHPDSHKLNTNRSINQDLVRSELMKNLNKQSYFGITEVDGLEPKHHDKELKEEVEFIKKFRDRLQKSKRVFKEGSKDLIH